MQRRYYRMSTLMLATALIASFLPGAGAYMAAWPSASTAAQVATALHNNNTATLPQQMSNADELWCYAQINRNPSQGRFGVVFLEYGDSSQKYSTTCPSTATHP